MSELDLPTLWAVLKTEAANTGEAIETVPSGATVAAGDILVGVDGQARRHLLIPLRPGEAFAEDRSGRAVHLLRLEHEGITYLSAVCLQPELNEVFSQFARELVSEVADAASPSRSTVAALARWRRLFSEADRSDVLSEAKLIGLMAELLTLEWIVRLDPNRRLSTWTGPSGSQHDFRAGADALEVKATLVREGRVVSISSVEQLNPPDHGRLHLLHHRFEADPSGQSIPDLVLRVQDLGVEPGVLLNLLARAAYRTELADRYRSRRYSLADRRAYNVDTAAFPRIVPASFTGGVTPPGTHHITYSIDLSNEPPMPLPGAELAELISRIATA